jgi:hypothetical protein
MDFRVTELSVNVMPEAVYSALSAPDGDSLYAVVPGSGRFPLLFATGEEYAPCPGDPPEELVKTGAYVSPDLGDTWIPVQIGYGNWNVHDVAYGDGTFMAATGEIYRSYDCMKWETTTTSALGLRGNINEGFSYSQGILHFCNGDFYAWALSGTGNNQRPATYITRKGDQWQRQTAFVGTAGSVFQSVYSMAFDRLSGHYLACDRDCYSMYAVDQVSAMHPTAWTNRTPSWASQYLTWALAQAEDGIIALAVKSVEHEGEDDYWYSYPATAFKTTDGGSTWTEIWSHEDIGDVTVQ